MISHGLPLPSTVRESSSLFSFTGMRGWLAAWLLFFCMLPAANGFAATLLGQYRMEEASWNGTAGEVKDSATYAGGPFNGTASGSPLPAPVNTLPARAGSPGTCGNGAFFGGSGTVKVTGLPVNTSAGAKTSVAFWMYWDGTNSVMPIGWFRHDLWLVSNRFGFNTASSDVYGISSAGLANGWHHVAAIFTNGSVTSNQLYIDGVAQALTQLQSTPNNVNATVSSTLTISGWGSDSGYKFSSRIDEVKVYDGALNSAEVSALYSETHPCAPTLIAEWRFDESSWGASVGEVEDSVGTYPATAVNGASTASVPPAPIAGNPGTCGYGVFDGSNDYVALPTSFPSFTSDFSVTAWIRTTDRSKGGQRILIDDEKNTGGYGFSLGDGGAGRLRFFARGSSPIILDTPAVINNDTWYFVAAIADISAGKRWMYVYDTSGTQLSAVSTNFTGWGTDIGAASIGGENNASTEASASFRFKGNIDDVRVHTGALSATEIAALAAKAHACPVPATLLAEYRLEESAWIGAAGEVKDSSGNNRDGTTIGAPRPSPASVSPARPGSPGTCGYGGMPGTSSNGGAFSFSGLPVSTTPGAKTSVSFWMYWDGTNSVMPIGWNVHDLWLVSGHFGFNTGNSDVFGISSAGLANGWHHVVAIFTNGSVPSNKLYIDGAAQTLTQRLSTPNNANAYVNSTLRAGGWQASTGYRFSGRLDEIRVYNGELKPGEVSAIYLATHVCGGVIKPSGFNCVLSGADALTGRLYTKLAGAPFSFDVVALKDTNSDGVADGVETTYASDADKTVTVELVDGSGATACASRAAINPAVSQTLIFTKTNQPTEQGRKSAANMTVSQAYPDLRCRVTDANQSPSIVGCSSDNFAVRPSAVSLNVSPALATPPSASATPTIKAGASFTLAASTSPAAGYAGSLLLDAAKLTAQITSQDATVQSGGIVGTLSPVSLTANASASNNASYTEVGYLYLAPGAFRDDIYTSVDQPSGCAATNSCDCVTDTASNANLADALASGRYGCSIGNMSNYSLGRFIPDHFDVSYNTPLFAPGCGATFTYMGQLFNYAVSPIVTVTAKNAGNNLTANYSGNFWKITNASLTGKAYTALSGMLDTSGVTGTDPVIVKNNDGTGTLTFSSGTGLSFTRPAAPTAPFNAEISLAINVIDEDAVSYPGNPARFGQATAGNGMAFSTGKTQRYGRLRLSNVYGSVSPLQMPVEAQYWSGNSWVKNSGDSCTALAGSNLLLTPSGWTAVPGALAGGSGIIALTPTAPGSIKVCADLAPDNGVACSATSANLPWLQSKWPGGAAYNNDPSATATFGIFSPEGHKGVYNRELY